MKLEMNFTKKYGPLYYQLVITADSVHKTTGLRLAVSRKNRKNSLLIYYGEQVISPIDFKVNKIRSMKKKLKPVQLNEIKELLELLGDPKDILIYTGAGISESAGIPNLKQLKNLISFNRFWRLIILCKWRAKYICQNFMWFVEQLESCAPTKTHIILDQIQKAHDILIFTENRDLLHQRAGSRVILRQQFKDFKILLSKKQILVLGVSEDHSGLLREYKEQNSEASIITICNKEVPNYLMSSDFYFHGDLHEIIIELESHWRKDNKYGKTLLC